MQTKIIHLKNSIFLLVQTRVIERSILNVRSQVFHKEGLLLVTVQLHLVPAPTRYWTPCTLASGTRERHAFKLYMGGAQQVLCPEEQLQVQDHSLLNALPILGIVSNFHIGVYCHL